MTLRDINLVPPEVAERRLVLRHLARWAVAMAAAAGAFAAGHLFWAARQTAASGLGSDHSGAGAGPAALVRQIQQAQAELERLSFVLRLSRRQPYSHVLWKLAELAEPDTWLSGLYLSRSPERSDEHLLRLSGYSLTNAGLGVFLNRLSAEPMFRSVTLRISKQVQKSAASKDESAPSEMIEFQVECGVPGR